MGEIKEELQEAFEHMVRANELLEEKGDGTSYVGEDHMMESLYALDQLLDARLEVQESTSDYGDKST